MIDDVLETETSTAWIVRFQAGDPGEFGRLHARFASELMAFLAARCPPRLSVEDLSQAVWLKLWNNRTRFQDGEFRAWMYRIARNHLIDQFRRKEPDLQEDDFDPSAPQYDQDNDWLDALRECLDQVEGSFVDVVRGKTSGMSTEQLAEKYAISPSTVATRIHRGKQLLRECVQRKTQ